MHLKRSLTECGRCCRLFSAIGLTPLATADLFRLARPRASARLTVGYSPRPISRRMPSMDMRCTQLFEPRMETFRYVPSPSEYLPGLVRLLTLAVVNLFISPPFPRFFPQDEWALQDLEGIHNLTRTGLDGTLCRPTQIKRDIVRSEGSKKRAGIGGESGIRTHDELAPIPVFETGAFVRSAISPRRGTSNYSISARRARADVRTTL